MIFFRKHKKRWVKKVSLGVCGIFLIYPLLLFAFCPCPSSEDVSHPKAQSDTEVHHDSDTSHSHGENHSNDLASSHPHDEEGDNSHSHSEKESSCCCQISQDPFTFPSEIGISDYSSLKKISFLPGSHFLVLETLDSFPNFYTHYGTAPPRLTGRLIYLQKGSFII